MPLTTAENDADFVVELSDKINEQNKSSRDITTAMVEEYLRRRTTEIENQLRRETAEQLRDYQQLLEIEKEKSRLLTLSGERLCVQLDRTTEALGRLHRCQMARAYWRRWEQFVQDKKEQKTKQAAEEEKKRAEIQHRVINRWCEVMAAAKEKKKAENAAKEAMCREEELKGEIEVLKQELEKERAKGEEVDEKHKSAFVRSVVALNKQAVHALKGEEGEADAAAIEEILSGNSSKSLSRRSTSDVSHLVNQKATVNDNAHNLKCPPGVCPVHNLDEDGTFYHKCYAPDVCQHHPSSPNFEPFVVKASPHKASRTVCASPYGATAAAATRGSSHHHHHHQHPKSYSTSAGGPQRKK